MTSGVFQSAKRNHSSACHPWYDFYAMFSDSFAEEVLKSFELPRGSIVLDPWLGTGTTSAAAWRLGYKSVGCDINPVMTVIANARTVTKTQATGLPNAIYDWKTFLLSHDCTQDDALLAWFEHRSASLIRALESVIRKKWDNYEADFLLVCLFEAVRYFAKIKKSKNPTWIKAPDSDALISIPEDALLERFVSNIVIRSLRCQRKRLPGVPQ